MTSPDKRRLAARIAGLTLHAYGSSDEIAARARKGLETRFEREALAVRAGLHPEGAFILSQAHGVERQHVDHDAVGSNGMPPHRVPCAGDRGSIEDSVRHDLSFARHKHVHKCETRPNSSSLPAIIAAIAGGVHPARMDAVR